METSLVLALLLFSAVSICAGPRPIASGTVDSEGLLLTSICHDYKDCQVTTGEPGLALACYYNVKKCNCFNTYQSEYHLGVTGNKCLMSKYGPCGTNSKKNFKIGCRDNFECIDGRCRDPVDPFKTVKGAYEFPVNSCSACQFSDDLDLECTGTAKDLRCRCEKVEIPDSPGTSWDLRNYDGMNNCSTGEHGPCGIRNGIRIGCHGDGISCVEERCRNTTRPNPLSGTGERCSANSDCQPPLVCSSGFTCIAAKSVAAGGRCGKDDECQEGLSCETDPNVDPFNPSTCMKKASQPASQMPGILTKFDSAASFASILG